MPELALALVQSSAGTEFDTNVERALDAVRRAADGGAQLVALPESFHLRLPSDGGARKLEVAQEIPGPLSSALGDLAREKGIYLLAGSSSGRAEVPGRVHKTSLPFDPTGAILAKYRKIHMFDVTIAGQVKARESEFVEAGTEVVTANTDEGVTEEPFAGVVARIKADRGRQAIVPGFELTHGNERATYLLLLESPGPKAVQTGVVSLDNPDPTAANLKAQLAEAGIKREQIAMWNVVPWHLDPRRHPGSPTAAEIELGCTYLPFLLDHMPNLRVVVLLGGTARRAHIFLSRTTTARIVSCHHTSAVVMCPAPWKAEENIAAFRFIASTT